MRIVIPCLLTSALVVAGCGSGAGESAVTSGSDTATVDAGSGAEPAETTAPAELQPCAVLSPAEIEAVLGDPVLGPEPSGVECAFRREPGPDGLRRLAVRLRLEVNEGSPRELFERYVAAIREALGGDYEPAMFGGLGSVAAWDGDAIMTSVPVNDGRSAFLVVQLTGVDASLEREQAERLAARALDAIRQASGV